MCRCRRLESREKNRKSLIAYVSGQGRAHLYGPSPVRDRCIIHARPKRSAPFFSSRLLRLLPLSNIVRALKISGVINRGFVSADLFDKLTGRVFYPRACTFLSAVWTLVFALIINSLRAFKGLPKQGPCEFELSLFSGPATGPTVRGRK